MGFSVAGPVILLGLLAVLLPRALERAVPETLAGLGWLALLSALLLWAVSAGLFALLYGLTDARAVAFLEARPGAGLRHFAGLGARAALIWAPIAALVILTAPRRWKHARW